ncbi:FtsK/SpoIIIE domain-containing protein, partial [Streptomonospora algeriensis]
MSRQTIRFGDEPPLAARAAKATAHGAWRYRIQLAPVYAAGTLATTGAAAHAADWGEYWMIGAGASAAATAGCWIYHRAKESHWLTRAHASLSTAAAGGWLSAASVAGVLERPLPDLLGLGTLALGLPWWLNRRTRSRVSVEQRIEAWPQIAQTRPELRGSEVVSAVATAFGWRARVRLAAGQTGRKALEARDGVESALGTREGAVRIEPDKRNVREVTVHVTEVDPHAEPILWPGPTMTEISDPLTVGLYDDGEECSLQLFKPGHGIRHMMICGQTGSGKSGLVNLLLAEMVSLGTAVVWGIDLKGGQELGPWKPLMDRCATSVDEAMVLLGAAKRVVDRRGETAGERVWTPTRERPALIIVLDEAAELLPVELDGLELVKSLVRRGRSTAVSFIGSAQDSTTAAWGGTDLQAQLTIHAGFRMEKRKAKYAIKDLAIDYEVLQSIDEDTPGIGYIEAPGVKRPAPVRVRWIPDETVERLAADHAHDRPRLDETSLAAAYPDPAEATTEKQQAKKERELMLFESMAAAAPGAAAAPQAPEPAA